MTPQKPNNQPQLFRNSLEAMLNDRHPLYKLANSIDWQRNYHRVILLIWVGQVMQPD
ncbi:MAG: hypothetical protein JXB29_01405 [Sedimentisphaerales bacterium]|nr:hypothetical protein [Sedimentisphaerales bacterium]